MDDLTKGFLEHYQKTHPGMPIKYFDASEGLHISQFNSVDNPALPPKTLYKDFPPHESEKPMSEIRDTHFQNAAKLLHSQLQAIMLEALDGAWNNIDMDRRQRECIAQFAYDLAVHIVEKLDASPLVTLSDRIGYHEKFVNEVPDLTAWPNTSPEAP